MYRTGQRFGVAIVAAATLRLRLVSQQHVAGMTGVAVLAGGAGRINRDHHPHKVRVGAHTLGLQLGA